MDLFTRRPPTFEFLKTTSPNLAMRLRELAPEAQRGQSAWVRVTHHDGSVIEGSVAAVNSATLTVVHPARFAPVDIKATDIRSLDVRMQDRVRGVMMSLFMIFIGWVAMKGYAKLPWAGGDADNTVILALIVLAGLAFGPYMFERNGLPRWGMRWQTLYSDGP